MWIKLQVSFAKEPYKRDYTLQKKRITYRNMDIQLNFGGIHIVQGSVSGSALTSTRQVTGCSNGGGGGNFSFIPFLHPNMSITSSHLHGGVWGGFG